jgi:fluoroquinolone resistance protein
MWSLNFILDTILFYRFFKEYFHIMNTIDHDHAEFISINFKGLILVEEELSEKEFDGCTFETCDFTDATLKNCIFVDCHFINCNLSLVKLGYSQFRDVIFEGSKLIGVDWTSAYWPILTLTAPVKFIQCILNNSSFFKLNLQELVIEECKAHEVDFREGDFGEANFTFTDFTHSLFGKTNLRNADFTDASNYNIDVYQNELKNAKFSRLEAVNLLVSLGIKLVD